jgi:hypothetical protein
MYYIVWIVLLFGLMTARSAWAAAYGSGWYVEVQASSAYANNVSRSEDTYPVIDDTVSSLGVGIGYADMFNAHLRYTLSTYLDYNRFAETEGLSRAALSVMGELVYQPNICYENLWYQASFGLTHLDHKQAEGRDGYQAVLDLGLNRRLNMAATGRFGYRRLQQDATATAYDLVSQQLYAGVEVDLVHHRAYGLTLVTEYGFSHGDMLASGPNNMLVGLEVDAVSPDPVFSTCQEPDCMAWSAYRNDGRMQTLDAGLVLVVDQMSVDLTARYIDVQTNPQGEYHGWQLQLGAVWTR